MKNSNTTYEITPIGSEFVARVIFNDGYTQPMQLSGYYKTADGAQKRLEKHLEILNKK